MKTGFLCTVAGALAIIGAGQAHALVLEAKSEEQALRADVSKQIIGYTVCIAKANLACEASGASTAQECDLTTATATAPADAKGKFAGDVAKCDGKVNYMKKSKTLTPAAAYEAIGCVGDSDASTGGNQPYTNMNTYQAGAMANAKANVKLLGSLLPGALSGAPWNCSDQKCVAGVASTLAKWTAAVRTCFAACENDYVGKAGNGGGGDLPTPCRISPDGRTGGEGADPAFTACVEKAYASATKKIALPAAIAQIAANIQVANDGFYNSASNCPP